MAVGTVFKAHSIFCSQFHIVMAFAFIHFMTWWLWS